MNIIRTLLLLAGIVTLALSTLGSALMIWRLVIFPENSVSQDPRVLSITWILMGALIWASGYKWQEPNTCWWAPIFSVLLSLAGILALCISLLGSAYFVLRLVFVPENHISADPRILAVCWASVFGLILASGYGAKWPRAVRAILALSLAGCVWVFYLEHFNHLVQYDRWLKRGMPKAERLIDSLNH